MSDQKQLKTYEECYPIIDSIIKKFGNKWRLKSINWFDFEDVSQTIKIHIYNKWHLWDQTRALEPWVAQVASHQIKNIIRNNYSNYVRPCMQCKFNTGDDGCSFTASGEQDSSCSLYAKWSKNKKNGYGIKMPVSMEHHSHEINEASSIDPVCFDSSMRRLNEKMKEALSEDYYKVYEMLFLEKKTEEDVAKFMGYKTSEKNRKAGYKQIKNLKKMLHSTALNIISKNDIIL